MKMSTVDTPAVETSFGPIRVYWKRKDGRGNSPLNPKLQKDVARGWRLKDERGRMVLGVCKDTEIYDDPEIKEGWVIVHLNSQTRLELANEPFKGVVRLEKQEQAMRLARRLVEEFDWDWDSWRGQKAEWPKEMAGRVVRKWMRKEGL